MPYLLRVELPDVPGSLGRVAAAIGEAGGDIEAIEIVEKDDGYAVDDVLLEIPHGTMPDSVVSACSVLDGVSVLWINHYAAGGNIFLDLEVVEHASDDEVHELTDLRWTMIEPRACRQHDGAGVRQPEHVLEMDRAVWGLARHDDQPPTLLERHVGGTLHE